MYIIYVNKIEFQFLITGLSYNIKFLSNLFDKNEQIELKHFINHISQSITIDKSYVMSKDNKYENVFLIEDGWNSLKEILLLSAFGSKLHQKDHHVLVNLFLSMAECYVFNTLLTYYDYTYINITDHIELIPNSKNIIIDVSRDTIQEWKCIKSK
jgi:hypothetical protein